MTLKSFDGRLTIAVCQALRNWSRSKRLPTHWRDRLERWGQTLALGWFVRWDEDDGWVGVLVRLGKGEC